MRFKKIYIEITNGCNLNCKFCIGNKREIRFMSFLEFKLILDKINGFTKYLYFHILGEPLLHPKINQFIDYAALQGFYINITTNGYLIDKIKYNQNIRQLNISLHSYDEKYLVSLNDYLNNIVSNVSFFENTFVSFRLWTDSKYSSRILLFLKNYYGVSIDDNFNGVKLSHNVFFSQFHEFIWPDLNNNYYCEKGKCYGLINHIGILSDGSIVPCCLDSCGDICLGNIFFDDLSNVLKLDRVVNMINGFKNNKKIEELCKHCHFFND